MEYDPERITFFARTDARGKNVPFGIKAKDRSKHVYVIGKTGMGKSTLLENMAIQDIQNGEGIAFIDPHGSTADKLLEYVPPERIKDVLYFAPFDMDYPISFNVMEDVGYDRRHLVVSGLMSTFKKIWVDAWSARMEYILSNTLLALLEYPNSTLLGVNRMLSDKAYRDMVVAEVKDPAVRSFWVDEFAKYNERYMQEAGDAIKNKIGQFTANPLIRNIIGQPKSSFDVRSIMDDRKILIINLSKGLVGETNANLLGSMMITRIYLSAMSRANLSANEISNASQFYFYVDEFQSFANETFASILSEARKYKLNLTIAHQYIEQMEEEVRDAVFGNVGTTIAFRVGPLDAEFLEAVFTPTFLAPDIVNLGFAQIYLSLMIDGIGSRPFSAVTMPPIEQSHISCKDQIIASSRKAFAQQRADVEAAIHVWHAPIVKISPPKAEKTPERKPASEVPTVSPLPRPTAPPTPRPREEKVVREETVAVVEKTREVHAVRTEAPYTRPTPKPASDLSELRNVLRTIAGSEKEKKQQGNSQKSRETHEHKDQKREKPKLPVSDLKSALAQALAQNAAQAHEVTQAQQKETVHAPEAYPRIGTKPVEAQPAIPEVRDIPFDRRSISAKKIERMLRVTGKDNPPFRF